MRKFSTAAIALALSILALSGCKEDKKQAETAQNNMAASAVSWPRMRVDEFGCMMEKTFGHRDERFNCSLKGYENKGDPCHNADDYYEGFDFPAHLVKKVHPQLSGISLSWEGGALQMIIFSFDDGFTKEQVLNTFGLSQENPPDNINYVNAENNSLMLIGFEHMGAGDVDCEEEEYTTVLTPTIYEFSRSATASDYSEDDDGMPSDYVTDPDGDLFTKGSIDSDIGSYKDEWTASSTLAPQGKVSYDANNLSADRFVAWCEGVKGHGIGERVNLRITVRPFNSQSEIIFRGLNVANGYAKNQATWQNNSRIKTLRLYVGGKYWSDLHLKDTIKPQSFSFPEHLQIKTDKVEDDYQAELSFEIIEVYPGSKFDDACISGIALE